MYKIRIETIDTDGLGDDIKHKINKSYDLNFIGFYKEDGTRFAKIVLEGEEVLYLFPERLTFR